MKIYSAAKSRSWFALVLVVVIIAFLAVLSAAAMMSYGTAKSSVTEDQLRLQAANYASEGIELAKAYVITQTNGDRAGGWKNRVSGLSGKYVVSYWPSGYSIESKESETIEISEPYAGTFVRTVEFSDGPSGPDEKRITAEVEYGWSRKIQYVTSVTNVYGK